MPYFFANYGVNTVILRNRLRKRRLPRASPMPCYDALQAMKAGARATPSQWNIDPNKIGIMGFSAGAELAAPAATVLQGL